MSIIVKMKISKHIRFIVLLGSFLVGCASDSNVSQSAYNKGIGAVRLGMSKAEFVQVFPKAIPRGAKRYSTGDMEVMEVFVEVYTFIPQGGANRNGLTGTEGEPRWFYFFSDRLVQYGKPNDWPAEPDKIIELRVR